MTAPRVDPSLRVCPRCSGDLKWRAFEYEHIQHPACAACGFVLWQNPKPSVEALITREAAGGAVEVLLGRLAEGAAAGRWDAPGGFLNKGDRLHEALQRECSREMGIDVVVREVVGAFEQEFLGEPIISIVYRCEIHSGEPAPLDLIDEAAWFPIDALPKMAYAAIEHALHELRSRL